MPRRGRDEKISWWAAVKKPENFQKASDSLVKVWYNSGENPATDF